MAASYKNFSMSPAAADLGLGDALRQSLEDQEEERKKKLLKQARSGLGSAGYGPATQDLFGGMGGYSV